MNTCPKCDKETEDKEQIYCHYCFEDSIRECYNCGEEVDLDCDAYYPIDGDLCDTPFCSSCADLGEKELTKLLTAKES